MINARAETVASKPSFRAAFKSRRCLVPASQFYEWTKTTTPKQPYLLRCTDAPAFLMAGLWESWTDKATGEVVETFTIVTTAANDVVHPVHDRMPVILPRADWSKWLDPTNRDAASLTKLLRPYAGPM